MSDVACNMILGLKCTVDCLRLLYVVFSLFFDELYSFADVSILVGNLPVPWCCF